MMRKDDDVKISFELVKNIGYIILERRWEKNEVLEVICFYIVIMKKMVFILLLLNVNNWILEYNYSFFFFYLDNDR